jgi:Phasin protein
MTRHIESIPSLFDARTLCGMKPESFDYAERAYRTWCETAGEIQSHATQFLNNRLAKDSAAIARFGRCRSPVEAFNAQIDYASNAFADLVDEGQKVAAYFGKMATEEMLHGPLEQLRTGAKHKVAGKGKRPPHPVAGR